MHDHDTTTTPPPCSLRPMTPADEAFVLHLFGTTLRAQMPLETLDLSAEQLDALIEDQYRLMMNHYNSSYPWATISIVMRGDEPVGRLIIIDFDEEVRLGDLMILPEHQNNGICTYIMRMNIARGVAAGKKIRLHVEKVNRAVKLYERERFAIIDDLSSHWLMEYQG